MNKLITVNASDARNDFFGLLDKVYFENKSFLIRKAGVPIARLGKFDEGKNIDIMKFAGMWENIDSEKVKKYIYEGRKDKGKLKRKLPDLS
jgi:antitoxin (DNA-binding transcriptional repressor) of toxin-antitoxin stability system